MPIVARLDSPWCWYLTRDCARKCFLERLYMIRNFTDLSLSYLTTKQGSANPMSISTLYVLSLAKAYFSGFLSLLMF